ncbi:hypothetical protein COLO4_06901 [Corchorus olitorius]|uniref:Uncharacterized protein n=1 Tax=Corchorus olitorius TaxID=93759 RepID=A0A1R3KLM7_9ROSI|nr:hypothetical protein COLO4_06901 [Corchorus olitorius]
MALYDKRILFTYKPQKFKISEYDPAKARMLTSSFRIKSVFRRQNSCPKSECSVTTGKQSYCVVFVSIKGSPFATSTKVHPRGPLVLFGKVPNETQAVVTPLQAHHRQGSTPHDSPPNAFSGPPSTGSCKKKAACIHLPRFGHYTLSFDTLDFSFGGMMVRSRIQELGKH